MEQEYGWTTVMDDEDDGEGGCAMRCKWLRAGQLGLATRAPISAQIK
jgi:hypothetical protein